MAEQSKAFFKMNMIRQCIVGMLLSGMLMSCADSPAPAASGASGEQDAQAPSAPTDSPYLVVLGIGQDGGAPQTGSHLDARWEQPEERHQATSLGLVDPATGRKWMFEATPDFKQQWYALDTLSGLRETNVPDGIFLTHAHIGHYTGLMLLGHESVGAQGVPVYAYPKMAAFLTANGPWSQLVKYANIVLAPLESGTRVDLSQNVSVEPFLVPHRQEFSEVAGFIIRGPNLSVGFIPDIDSWEAWEAEGVPLESFLASVDIALVDGTFFENGELPGRDMSGFPHPFITHTMDRLASAPDSVHSKVHFIHLNHSNPALIRESSAQKRVAQNGFHLAFPGQIIAL